MQTLAANELFGLPPEWWSAVGIWATIVVYLLLAFFASGQLREARDLRRDQSRPAVSVDVHFRNVLIQIALKNSGQTSADDVRVTFDERPTSSGSTPLGWLDTTAFTKGIPSMAPGREMRFNFDMYPRRKKADLPMVLTGHVQYKGRRGKDDYSEPFIIDLTNYEGASIPDKTIHELATAVEKINKTIERWSQGNGIRVSTLDLDRSIARENRPMLVSSSIKARKEDGWRAAALVWIHAWRRRFGWHKW